MIRTLFAKLRAEASFIVLLAVAAAGAWLYVQYRQMQADRDGAVNVAEKICASAGVEWAASKGAPRGVQCGQRGWRGSNAMPRNSLRSCSPMS